MRITITIPVCAETVRIDGGALGLSTPDGPLRPIEEAWEDGSLTKPVETYLKLRHSNGETVHQLWFRHERCCTVRIGSKVYGDIEKIGLIRRDDGGWDWVLEVVS